MKNLIGKTIKKTLNLSVLNEGINRENLSKLKINKLY